MICIHNPSPGGGAPIEVNLFIGTRVTCLYRTEHSNLEFFMWSSIKSGILLSEPVGSRLNE